MSSLCESDSSLGQAIFGDTDLGDRRRTARLVDTFDLNAKASGWNATGEVGFSR